jgi:thymidine kinase
MSGFSRTAIELVGARQDMMESRKWPSYSLGLRSRNVAGKLELMMGPMRSNKTAELLRRADMRRQYANQYVLVLKPSDDTKGGPGVVESRNPNGHGKMNALEFNSQNPWEVLKAIIQREKEIGKKVECIAIDEGQFLNELFLFTRHLLDAGHDVLIAGLDLDFRALPFGEMLNLTWLVNAYGGSITECMAYCGCGARALYSQRLINGKPAPYDSQVKMPGDSYEPRCAEHFVLPGKPH